MSGAEAGLVIGLISGVIAIIDATKTVYDAAKDAKGQPEVFRKAASRLPLILRILQNAKTQAAKLNDDEKEEEVESLVKACREKAEKLQKIFNKVVQKEDDGWFDRYKKAVGTAVRGNKVEGLMEGILKDIQVLACDNLTGTASEEQVKELGDAIQEMEKMPDSIPQETGALNQTHSGSGHNIANTGGGTMKNAMGAAFYEIGRDANFQVSGTSISSIERAVSFLRHTNPKVDKAAIEYERGPHLPICSDWIFSHDFFIAWREKPHSQLLWIKGDSGTGKTMLLVGVVNRLLPGISNTQKQMAECKIGAYFFCERNDMKTLPQATTVLKGLIHLLVLQKDSLKEHLEQLSFPESGSCDQDSNSVFTLSEILMNMLFDLATRRVYLIVDAIGAIKEGLEQLLAQIRYISQKCKNVRWLVSSHDSSLLRKILGADQNIQHLELNPSILAAPVNSYVTCKLSSNLFPWLKDNFSLQATLQQNIAQKAPNPNFLYTTLLFSELALENASTALSTLISMPPNLSIMIVHEKTRHLITSAYSYVEAFKNNHQRQDYTLLSSALTGYNSAISVAKKCIPHYDRGLIAAWLGQAECFRELSHARKYPPPEQLSCVSKARTCVDEALKIAERIGDGRRGNRARFDKAVVEARRVLVEGKIVLGKEEGGGRPRPRERAGLAAEVREARRVLGVQREVMVREEGREYGVWADKWLKRLNVALGE